MLTSTLPSPDLVMAVTDKAFYKALGRRIADRRKALEITQVELAERLGVAQQTMAHYEGGTVRVAIALLPPLAKALDMSIEGLIGEEPKKLPGKRGPAPRIQRQLEQLSQLPKAKQQAVMQVLDSVLAQAAR
ncbi:helix-turn-helix transcriptional regulator [Dokdonella soli]